MIISFQNSVGNLFIKYVSYRMDEQFSYLPSDIPTRKNFDHSRISFCIKEFALKIVLCFLISSDYYNKNITINGWYVNDFNAIM